MNNVIKVGMADYNICRTPDSILTLGLGSCVGIVLYDSQIKICGLAHIMLPDSSKIVRNDNRKKFADTAIFDMYKELLFQGAKKQNMIAKIAGGAKMFALQSQNEFLCVGERNVEAVKENLEKIKIPIVAEDTGNTYGRTIEFFPETGMLTVKLVGIGVSTI